MTWIIGTPCIYGYSVGISDICVRFADGSESDCLQKIRALTQHLAAGFAGSVAIGFAMLESLSKLVSGPAVKAPWDPQEFTRNWPEKGKKLYRKLDEEFGSKNPLAVKGPAAWDPAGVTRDWPERAKEIFHRFPETERRLGSQVMLVGVFPDQAYRFKRLIGGPSIWAIPAVYTFRSPDFISVAANLGDVVSIGIGAKLYSDHLKDFSSDHEVMDMMEAEEAAFSTGTAFEIVRRVTNKLIESPTPGISSHLHACVVTHGGVEIAKNDGARYNKSDKKWEEHIMPTTAGSYSEFLTMTKVAGVVPEEACA